MESITRISANKSGLATVTQDAVIRDLVRCGYINAADIADRFAGRDINPATDPVIVNDAGGIFTTAEFNDREFQKTASVMKMVIDGYAGAGTITMGGYDYHTGERTTGEARDLITARVLP